MSVKIIWFTTIVSYIIQTRTLSSIYMNHGSSDLSKSKSSDDNSSTSNLTGIPVYISFFYFLTWLLLLPTTKFLTRFFNFDNRSSTNNGFFFTRGSVSSAASGSSSSTSRPIMFLDNENSNDYYENESLYLENNKKMKSSSNTTSLYANDLNVNPAPVILNKGPQYYFKILSLSILVLLPVLTYNLALSISPAFDTAFIQNISIFEISILLLGIFGQTKRQNVFRNYCIMLFTLISALVISYTKANSDMLAGKLTINEETGELNDPFLFDRLKGALACGLGALPMGLFYCLWNKWFNMSPSLKLNDQAKHLSLVAICNLILLLPLILRIPFHDNISILLSQKSFWLPLLISVIFGTIPHMLSLLYLLKNLTPEFAITTNLGTLIFIGITEWLLEESKQTTIVRGEVIGYICLTIGCTLLTSTYNDRKHYS